MFHFGENGMHAAAVGARVLDAGVCLGPVPANLGRVAYCVGKCGLRLVESGSKLFELGHDPCRGASPAPQRNLTGYGLGGCGKHDLTRRVRPWNDQWSARGATATTVEQGPSAWPFLLQKEALSLRR